MFTFVLTEKKTKSQQGNLKGEWTDIPVFLVLETFLQLS